MNCPPPYNFQMMDPTFLGSADIDRRYRELLFEVLKMTEEQGFDYLETALHEYSDFDRSSEYFDVPGLWERFKMLKVLHDLVSRNLSGTEMGGRFRAVHLLLIESYVALFIGRQCKRGNDIRGKFDEYVNKFRAASEK